MTVLIGSNELKSPLLGSTTLKQIRAGSNKVYPKGYTPNANTLLFIPMKTDLLDHWPLGISITNNNSVSLSSWVWGASINVWNFGDGNTNKYLSLNNSSNMQGAYTISVWWYFNAYSSSYGSYFFVQWTNTDNKWLHAWVWLSSESRWLLMAFYWNDLDTNQFPSTWVRHHFVFSYDWNWTKKIYQDWVLKASATQSKFTGTLYTAILGSRPRQTAARVNGYMSDFILENRVRTQTEITEYYNLTKSLYWLS